MVGQKLHLLLRCRFLFVCPGSARVWVPVRPLSRTERSFGPQRCFRGQREFVQVLRDGGRSRMLRPGPASSPRPPHLVLTSLALNSSGVGLSGSKRIRSHTAFIGGGHRDVWRNFSLLVSIFSSRWSLKHRFLFPDVSAVIKLRERTLLQT